MAKTIGTILSLTDRVSPALVTIGKNFDSLDKRQQALAKSTAYQLNSYAKSLGSAARAAAQFAGASALALGGAAIKVGLSEAMGLETYRTQLLTATKDTQRAAEVMRYAIDLANKTPFESAEMASAASVLEMAGLQSEKYLTLLGDVAAATNRTLEDTRHGFINAFTVGEYASFREVTGMALNAGMIEEFGASRGITDRAEALYVMLQEKFGGGMAELAKTTKGTWASITDVTKNSLANLIGATNEGTVRAGSVLDVLKTKANDLSETMTKWQNDGTIEAWSTKFADGFSEAWSGAERLWGVLSDNKDVVLGIGGTILAVNALGKGITSLNATLTATKGLLGMIKGGAIGLSPLGTATVVGAVAASAAIAANRINEYGEGKVFQDVNGKTYDIDEYKENAEKYKELAANADNYIDQAKYSFYSFGEGLIGFVSSLGVWLQDGIVLKVKNTWNRIFGDDSDTLSGAITKRNPMLPIRNQITANALGTHYFRGGRSLVGEYGPELVSLPAGSRIYSHSETKQIMQRGGNTISLSFTINGITDPDAVADTVCGKIMEALDNV